MVEAYRPKVEDMLNSSPTCSYTTPNPDPKYLEDPITPKCLADAVSETEGITIGRFAKKLRHFHAYSKISKDDADRLATDCIIRRSYSGYLPADKANRPIVRRKNKRNVITFIFGPKQLEKVVCILPNGFVHSDIKTYGEAVGGYATELASMICGMH